MQQKSRAILFADWSNGRTDSYPVQFNPKELLFVDNPWSRALRMLTPRSTI